MLNKYLLNKKIKTVQGLPVTRGTEKAWQGRLGAGWGGGGSGGRTWVAGPRGRLHTFQGSGPSLAWSYPTLFPGRDLGTPRPETCSPQERERWGRLAGGGAPGPSPPNENGPSPCEAPRAPPLSKPQRPGISGRRERRRGPLCGCLGLSAPPAPPLTRHVERCRRPGAFVPRCQAAPGTAPRGAPAALGTARPDGRPGRVGLPGLAKK